MSRTVGQIGILALVVGALAAPAGALPRHRASSPAITTPTAPATDVTAPATDAGTPAVEATQPGPQRAAPRLPRGRINLSDEDFVDGVCYFPAQLTAPNDELATKMEAACHTRLFGMAGNISVPGLVFIGMAFGKSTHFMIVPAASVGGGLSVPLYRPQLECDLSTETGSRKGQYSCDIPSGIHFVASFVASLNIAFGAMFFPSAGANGAQVQEFGTPIGAFGGVELGLAEYAKARTRYKLALELGVVLGLLPQSTTVGTSGIFGFQPGISIQF